METTISDSWRSLPLEKYDGSSGPDGHLNAYLTHVTLLTEEDAALCRLFPTSLKGLALSWFIKPSPSSINSFEELASLFTVQFATNRPYQLTSLVLANIRQEKKESLRSFMDRFNKIAIEIKKPEPGCCNEDFKGVDRDQDDLMVISVEINNCIIKKTLVDQGSSADILYWKAFKQIGILEEEVKHYDEPLVGFSGERVTTKGFIDLYTCFGYNQDISKTIKIRYIVVNANTSYNILLGRPSINA
uniref:Retrotransposon gag domain-containing protein n=1 Tax=Cajanus cajan TaxID=3821 RepID=A0A151SLS9_CAJCA|nr:hypothetical protein KK1_002021 [Cajanus cajan]